MTGRVGIAGGDAGRMWVAVILAASAVGVALRLAGLLEGRSLWMDEALLASRICESSFVGLLGPLGHNQAAPPGFLLVERLAVAAFGANETALRLFPCLASIATMALVYRIGRANLGIEAAALGLALAAVAPGLLYFGAEAKQYAVDAAAALLVVDLAAAVLREGPSRARLATLGGVGVVLVGFSHPVIFVLAGAGTTLFVDRLRRGSRREVVALAAVGACWGLAFLAIMRLSLDSTRNNRFLYDFWQFAFLPMPPRSLHDVLLYPSAFLGLFDTMLRDGRWGSGLPIERAWTIAAMAGWFAGVAALVRGRRGGLLALLVSPLVFAVVAAMLRQYPLRGRMVLFDVGLNLVLVAAGLAATLRAAGPAGASVGRIVVVVLLALASLGYAADLSRRSHPYGMRAVLTKLAGEAMPGDPIYVDAGSEPSFKFYRDFGRIDGLDRLGPVVIPGDSETPEGRARMLDSLRGRPRVWVLSEDGDASRRDPPGLGRPAKVLESIESHGSIGSRPARAALYDLR